MFQIKPARFTDRDAVLALLGRLQAEPPHHIGFHGETPESLGQELTALGWPARSVLAVDDAGRVRGVLSVSVDLEQGSARWYGPFVDVPAHHPAGDRIWLRTADALYAEALKLPILFGIKDTQLYGHGQHQRLAAFARRHGFAPTRHDAVCSLTGMGLARLFDQAPSSRFADRIHELVTGDPMDQPLTDAVRELHDQCFPDAVAGTELLRGQPDRIVVVAEDAGAVLGYATGVVREEDFLVDFVAVAPSQRGHELGAALVVSLVQRLADRFGARWQVTAMISAMDEAPKRMLRRLGFTEHRDLVSYRRRAISRAA